jgi:hypothetical protein
MHAAEVRLLLHHRRQDFREVFSVEQPPSRQYLVQHAAERPDVRSLVRWFAAGLTRDSSTPPCPASYQRESAISSWLEDSADRQTVLPHLRQSEVQHLHYTFVTPITLAGFKSRWTIPFS